MDDARFDHLTRALGTMLTRRRGVVASGANVQRRIRIQAATLSSDMAADAT